MNAILKADQKRYAEERGKVPLFQKLYRRTQILFR